MNNEVQNGSCELPEVASIDVNGKRYVREDYRPAEMRHRITDLERQLAEATTRLFNQSEIQRFAANNANQPIPAEQKLEAAKVDTLAAMANEISKLTNGTHAGSFLANAIDAHITARIQEAK